MKIPLQRRKKTSESERRRPLAASSSPKQSAGFSYYRQGQGKDSDEAGRSRRQPLRRSKTELLQFMAQRFGAIAIVVAVLALFVSSVQVSMKPRLNIVNDTAVYRLHPDSVYEASIEQLLRSSWLNTNKITIDTDRIINQLKTDYPEIADASIALPVLGQRPLVYLQLTRPSLLLVNADGSASVLDEKGRVLAPSAQVDNLDSFKLPAVSDQSGLRTKVGNVALTTSAVSFMRTVSYQLHAAHLGYSRLVLPPTSQELDVFISGQPYFIKFNMHDDRSVRQQAGTAIATIRYLGRQGKLPASYVDARLPGRVYYK